MEVRDGVLRIGPPLDGSANAGRDDVDRVLLPFTALARPYTATNEPKRGPFSWPSSTW